MLTINLLTTTCPPVTTLLSCTPTVRQ
uniref:Uncharacterized protein n=1 Tax=Arundo donax TaxID=35708 RepID=A0A0A8YH05_ARUDO